MLPPLCAFFICSTQQWFWNYGQRFRFFYFVRMDAVLGALVAGAVGQAIQPLVDRIARLEGAAVSNDQPAPSSETAEDPRGIQAKTATRELRVLLLLPRLARTQELRALCLCRARVMLLEPPGRIPALIQLLAWIRKLRPQASITKPYLRPPTIVRDAHSCPIRYGRNSRRIFVPASRQR